MLAEFSVRGAVQYLFIWYCSVQALFTVGGGRSCRLEQGWALPCSWLVRKLAAAPVTLTTLELFLRLSCQIDLYPCSAFVRVSV